VLFVQVNPYESLALELGFDNDVPERGIFIFIFTEIILYIL